MLSSNSVFCCEPHSCDHLMQEVICRLFNYIVTNADYVSNNEMTVNTGQDMEGRGCGVI
jgi:hypothetical protein